jgi:glycosyltransferase involved in cell wall biosynthesis
MVALANGFAERGYSVDLVLVSAEGPYLKEVAANVRIVDLKARRVLASLPALVRYLRREQPASLLAAMGHANVTAVMARHLAHVSTRVVVSERTNFSISRAHAVSLRQRMIGYFMRWAYPRADGVVTVSSGVADDLVKSIGLSRESISVVYNPVITNALLTQSQFEPSHPWFRVGELPVVLGVGRLTAAKDFPTLLHAFARLRDTRQIRLVILGEGEARSQLEALIAELGLQNDVSLPGFVENPIAYMRRSAVFVLSSAWEGLPNVLIQAMACGSPVVSTDCPSGPNEILENGRWGRLVPVGDVVALADAMAAVLDERTHPAVASRASEFSVDRAVDAYLRVMFPCREPSA